jgi:hypothetical protein
MRKKPSPFVFVIVDEAAKVFAVEGPMVDDRERTDAVWEAQQKGRQVRCFTSPARDSAIKWGQGEGLTLIEDVLHRPA